jgi:hypothetical protein
VDRELVARFAGAQAATKYASGIVRARGRGTGEGGEAGEAGEERARAGGGGQDSEREKVGVIKPFYVALMLTDADGC